MSVLSDVIGDLVEKLHSVQLRVAELEYEREQARTKNRPKLRPNEAQQIRILHRDGLPQKDIAQMYEVHPATISRIISGVYH